MKAIVKDNIATISLDDGDKIMGNLSAKDIQQMLLGKGVKADITEQQAAILNSGKEIEIELDKEVTTEKAEEETVENVKEQPKKSFDGKGIYGENISSRFEFLNKGSEKVWEVVGDYLDRGYMITNLVVARGWSSYRCDFDFRRGQIYRDVYRVRGEEITLLREIANDSFPDKTGCDGRRVIKKSINKLDDGALGIKLLVHEEKGPIELKIVMDKIY